MLGLGFEIALAPHGKAHPLRVLAKLRRPAVANVGQIETGTAGVRVGVAVPAHVGRGAIKAHLDRLGGPESLDTAAVDPRIGRGRRWRGRAVIATTTG